MLFSFLQIPGTAGSLSRASDSGGPQKATPIIPRHDFKQNKGTIRDLSGSANQLQGSLPLHLSNAYRDYFCISPGIQNSG
jgi:hypothetical protein